MQESYEKIEVSVLYVELTCYGIMCVTLSKDRIYQPKGENARNILKRDNFLAFSVFFLFFFSFLSEDISDKWEAENVDEHVDVCLTEAEFKADREEELTRGVS